MKDSKESKQETQDTTSGNVIQFPKKKTQKETIEEQLAELEKQSLILEEQSRRILESLYED